MSKWIDADALIMALRLEYPMIPMFKENRKEWEIKTEGYRKAEEVIKEAPSIDIVRCGECIWRDKDNQGEDYCTYVKGLADINEDSFCSWGERESE